MANHWLFKTEPNAYSFEQLERDKGTVWDGVKNNLALKYLRGVSRGDWILIYHTGGEKAAVGVAKVMKGPYPDPARKDPKLVVVDIKPEKALARSVSLSEMKANPKLAGCELLRLPRLSIMPVSERHWKVIEGMVEK
ncbi:MAG: EVE domain-containing protein [Candidatus Binatia bacterium]